MTDYEKCPVCNQPLLPGQPMVRLGNGQLAHRACVRGR